MPRPAYGFFKEYPLASAATALYEPTRSKSLFSLNIRILPELAEQFVLANGGERGRPIAVEVRMHAGTITLSASLVARCHLSPMYSRAPNATPGRHLESWDVTFSEVSARSVMQSLKPHFLHPAAAAALLGKELQLMPPRTCIRTSTVELPTPPIRRPSHDAQGESLSRVVQPMPSEKVSVTLSGVVEAPQSRTLLLEGEHQEIISYTLPKRVADAIAELAAPYKT